MPGIRVHAFEPIPPLFGLLKRNLAIHGLDATVFECALGSRPGLEEFAFYPNNSLISSSRTTLDEARENVRSFLLNQDGQAGVDGPTGPHDESALEQLLELQMQQERYPCAVRTLSEVIRELDVERIDLLKIDAENAEYEVLQGIGDADWPRIRQIAMEVHDHEGRLTKVAQMLEGRGFVVAHDQEAMLQGSALFNVFAIRPEDRIARGVPAPDAASPSPRWTGANQLIGDVRDHLAAVLPAYMVPATLVCLDEWPLTANGKLDRRMLPVPRSGDAGKSSHRAPRSAMERYLCTVYAEVLRRDSPGIDDDFFELGGHSLSLLAVHARLCRTLGELPLQALYEHRCVAELAAYLTAKGASLGVSVGSPHCVVSLNESSCTSKLFIVHPLSGVASAYTALAARLADVRRCYGVQAPDNFEDRDLTSFAERVECYADAISAEQPDGPYDLAGWSSGGWLAYEVAVELTRRGCAVASTSILDVTPPLDEFKQIPSTYYGPIKGLYQDWLKMDWSALDGLDEAAGIERVVAEAKAQRLLPAHIGDREARQHFRYLRNWAHNLNSYEASTSSLNVDVYISRVDELPGEQARYDDRMRATWRGLTDGELRAFACDGDHDTLVAPPHVAGLAEALAAQLAARDARGGAR
jgi:FkbM family methyltransferase